MAAKLTSAAKTDVGLKRTNNEDNFIMVPSHGLYVLADGMGGHASGQVASSMCVSHVAQFICEISHQPGFEFPYKPNPSISREANLLVNAIKFANERVYIQSCKERSMEGMGTTVTAILNGPHGLILAHVGDSRIYRVRNGQITQMSRDHSLLNHLLDTGELKPEDAAGFANKNVILRAIGLKENVDVDVKEVPREKGDIYMMCSDGLSDIVSESLITQAITSSPNLNEACNKLIALALKAGGKDNVTVVCVGVEQADESVPNLPSQGGPAQNVSRPPMGMMSAGGIPNTAGMPALGGLNANGRSSSQPMMTRAPSYSNAVSVPSGMGAMPPMTPMGGMNGMVPMPMRGMGMAPVPGQTVSPVPVQPAQPVRMHSVREVVERAPAPRAMPKPVGSAGRSSSAGAMPMIPGMGKSVPAKPESKDAVKAVSLEENVAQEQDGFEDGHTLDMPGIDLEMLARHSDISSGSSTEKASVQRMKDVSSLSPEEKADLPETGLLFTEPPVSAAKTEDRLEQGVTPGDSFDDEDDDDEDRTQIQPRSVLNGLFSGSSFSGGAPSRTPSTEMNQARVPEGNDAGGAVLMSSDEIASEYGNNSGGRVMRKEVEPAHRGYIPPENVIEPPHHDYDEDDDNIEIASILFGGDEDEDATRQYRRPPRGKW